MTTVLVTGATGLIGANVCRLLRRRGDTVHALVRPGSDPTALLDLGVIPEAGSITDRDALIRAAEDTDVIVNSAALLGGGRQDMGAQLAVNHVGSLHCYDAARGRRVVELTTTPFLRPDRTLTEHPELRPEQEVAHDPYAVSKGRAYRDGLQRVAAGEDIVFVIPGGTFGPSPVVHRAVAPTSFNALIRAAVRGRLRDFAAFPVPWVYATDVADVVVRSIDHGKAGVSYLAFGHDEPMTTAQLLSMACEEAGAEHRVADLVVDPADQGARSRFGSTIFEMATRTFPEPQFDDTETVETLGGTRTAVRDGLTNTIGWMWIHALL